MEPKIINKDAFVIMGTRSAITPKNESSETYGIIWQDFESYRSRVQPYSTDQKYYGVSFTTSKEGALDYLAGMAVSEGTTAPENLAIRKIPATRYAVFECPIHEIGQTKQYIFSQWLPSSPYKISTSPAFEQYPPEGQDPSPVFIYIPISEK